MKRKLLFSALVMALIIAVAGCADTNSTEPGPDQDPGTAVALVNGEEISRESFENVFENMKNMYTQQGLNFEGENSEDLLKELEQYVLDTMINEKVLLQEAEKQGHKVSDEEVNNEVELIKLEYGEEFEAVLSENQMDLDQLKANISNEIMIDLYLEGEIEVPAITEEEVLALYEEYSEMFSDLPEFDLIRAELEGEIKQERMGVELKAILQSLVENSEIQILI